MTVDKKWSNILRAYFMYGPLYRYTYSPVTRARRSIAGKDATLEHRPQIYAGLGNDYEPVSVDLTRQRRATYFYIKLEEKFLESLTKWIQITYT